MPGKKTRSAKPAERNQASPHYHGHRERLRTRFLQAGTQALTDYELLELVLFRALPRRDVKPLAKELIATFGSFAEVISAPESRLNRALSALRALPEVEEISSVIRVLE